ncbi:hypothetical protein H8K55_03010 [Undibacterium sp. LX15W]|uniref:Uncharacterized protein n=1 Tax=Undibacterium flavidum TaxID=2762297 RepID=A0ABR6Y7F2_9BURK|nr:hypothetical protein [Undibacterium flavidum]
MVGCAARTRRLSGRCAWRTTGQIVSVKREDLIKPVKEKDDTDGAVV